MEVTSYDPKKVNVSVNGTTITGFAADGLVTVAKSEDAVATNVGVKGDVVYEENANESGTIALTLQQTSSSVSFLRNLAANRQRITVTISDSNDYDPIKVNASDCRILKMPDASRGKTTNTVTVNIFVPNLVIR